jgi:hypothetical protein
MLNIYFRSNFICVLLFLLRNIFIHKSSFANLIKAYNYAGSSVATSIYNLVQLNE